MTRRQRNELVEERADFILAVEFTTAAYVNYFELQMHSGKIRKLLRLLVNRKIEPPSRSAKRWHRASRCHRVCCLASAESGRRLAFRR